MKPSDIKIAIGNVMVNLNVNAPTFKQIFDTFSSGSDTDKNIRFQDGKGLYTSSKASMTAVKAFFGFGDAMKARENKRDDGVQHIKAAIDRFSPGLGDRVLQRLAGEGKDFSHGIKGRDLATIKETANDIIREDKLALKQQQLADARSLIAERSTMPHNQVLSMLATSALQDPDLAMAAQGHVNPEALARFMANHVDIASSAEFYENGSAQSNIDNFGCAMSIGVLERMTQKGHIDESDLDDLHSALNPGNKPPVSEQLSSDLAGELTQDTLRAVVDKIYDVYMAEDGRYPINYENRPHWTEVRKVFADPESTGSARLKALNDCYTKTLSPMHFGSDNITNPLNDIISFKYGINDPSLRANLDA